jgi:hypothetical protein
MPKSDNQFKLNLEVTWGNHAMCGALLLDSPLDPISGCPPLVVVLMLPLQLKEFHLCQKEKATHNHSKLNNQHI